MSTLLDFTYQWVPGNSSRTLLMLHGTGGNEHDLLSLGRSLDSTAALLSPRGKVMENGMSRFFRRLAEGVFDIEDLKRRTHELADFIFAASQQHGFGSSQVVAVGYSNGANIAASLLLLRPEVLRAAVLLRPMVPLIPDTLPDLNGVHVRIAAGNQDSIVPVEDTRHLAELLRQSGASVTASLANAGHDLTNAEIEAAKSWVGGLKI
jgi:predicted esterase